MAPGQNGLLAGVDRPALGEHSAQHPGQRIRRPQSLEALDLEAPVLVLDLDRTDRESLGEIGQLDDGRRRVPGPSGYPVPSLLDSAGRKSGAHVVGGGTPRTGSDAQLPLQQSEKTFQVYSHLLSLEKKYLA